MNLDEIEQMRLLQRQNSTVEQFTIKALEAEIARLRAALELAVEAIERNVTSYSFAVLPQIKTALAKEGK